MPDSIRLGPLEQCDSWRGTDDFGMTNPKKSVAQDPYAKAAATSKPATVEEAIQWQSIAQLHRAEGELTGCREHGNACSGSVGRWISRHRTGHHRQRQ